MLSNWLKRLSSIVNHGRGPRRTAPIRRYRLRFDFLEDRLAPATAVLNDGVLTITYTATDATTEAVTVTSTGGNIVLGGNVSGDTTNAVGLVNSIVVQDDGGGTNQSLSFNVGNAIVLSGGLETTGVEQVTFNAAVTATGTAAISVTAPRAINVNANVTGGSGGVTLKANQQETATTGNFIGISVILGTVTTTGGGNTLLQGRGGTTSDFNVGVVLASGGVVTGSGTVTVEGTGGASNGNDNYGVYVVGLNSEIRSTGGAVNVVAVGGGTGGSSTNLGVYVFGSGRISAGGDGAVNVTGTGGNSAGSGNLNGGVFLENAGSITSSGGEITITGVGNGAGGTAFRLNGSSVTTANDADIAIFADSIDISGASPTINAGAGVVTLAPTSAGTQIDLGGGDAAGVLGLTGAELNRVTAGKLVIGRNDIATSTVTVSSAIAPTNAAGLEIISARNIAVNADVTAGSGGLTLCAIQQDDVTLDDFVGVLIDNTANVSTTGTGAITIRGRGGLGGVHALNDSSIFTENGAIRIEAISTGNEPAFATFFGPIFAGNDADITILADSMSIGPYDNNPINAGAGVVTLAPMTAGTQIILGAADAAGVLGLTSDELNRITAGKLVIGRNDIATANLIVEVNVNPTGATALELITARSIIVQGASLTAGPGGLTLSANQQDDVPPGDPFVGVLIQSGASVSATGAGSITILGRGDFGGVNVIIHSSVATAGGAIRIEATSTGEEVAFAIFTSDITTGNDAALTIKADTMSLSPTASLHAGDGVVTLAPKTAGTQIDLGGLDDTGGLVLADIELVRITAGTLVIGEEASGDISVTAAITRAASTNVELRSAGNVIFDGGSFNTGGGDLLLDPNGTGAVQPKTAGVDVTANLVSFASDLAIALNGTTVDTGYDQLNVAGTVDLTGVELVLSGSYTPASGNVFVIVSATEITGQFNDLADGDTLEFNGVVLRVAYTSTTVTLTAVPDQTLIVDTLDDVFDNDFSLGNLSLREAIYLAELDPDANTILFDPSLAGGTITLTIVGDTSFGPSAFLITTVITITGLTGDDGITIAQNADGGMRLFAVQPGGNLTLVYLTLTGGSAQDNGDALGGAIFNQGTVAITSSTLTQNVAQGGVGGMGFGGAIYNDQDATLFIVNSTLSANAAFAGLGGTGLGGAVFNRNGSVTVRNSTLANNAADHGGALYNLADTADHAATVNLLNSILADTYGGSDLTQQELAGTATINAASPRVNIVESSDILSGAADLSGVLAVDPQLGPLQDNGGPTMTMAIDKNSPACNAGKNADADGLEYDQRGPEFLRIVRGRVDLGAFEAVVDSIEFTDNFNRPNAPDLGPDYTQPSGQLAIRKETAVALGTEMGVALVNDLSSADVTMEADINVRREGSQAGLMARYTPAVGAQLESYYLARLVRRKGMVYAEILRVVDDQAQRLGQRVALGDHQRNRKLRFELVGNELRLLINGKVKVSVTDDAIAGPGLVGLRARNKGIFDNLAVTG